MTAKDQTRVFEIADEAAMLVLGARLFAVARVGDVFALTGDLGAGKTVLARGFIRAGCLAEGEAPESFDVPSPTFTLVQGYEARPGAVGSGTEALSIWHFDLYRLENPVDIWELGFEEALDEGVCLIEWPGHAGALLPDERLDIEILNREGSDIRDVTLRPGLSWRERIADV